MTLAQTVPLLAAARLLMVVWDMGFRKGALTPASLLGPPQTLNLRRLTKWPPSFRRTRCSSQATLARVAKKVLPGAETFVHTVTIMACLLTAKPWC